MNRVCMMLAMGLLACSSAWAIAPSSQQDYQAQYQILPLKNTEVFGVYRVSQFWQPESGNWLQRATISFSIKTLLSTHHYDYSDEVIYSGDKSLSYWLKENNNGAVCQVAGKPDNDKGQLNLTINSKNGNKQQSISNTDFDYTLFALRFPSRCASLSTGTTYTTRVMVPMTGEIISAQTRYLGIQSVTLPGDTEPRQDLCLIEIIGSDKKMLSQSWMNADGYLIYAIYPNYRLLLSHQTSILPDYAQEKSL
ncbi:hypothetical protein [Providencia rettgeri]|uniref:hypothetical protein n=1 Tax=Providencia TaxID=586 RepID=UPI00206688BE|nr:hypothetical protein [Providencia rettgeri]MDH2371881.1 hypothetical protein [Providencia rettgeri]UNJ79956.1 hypothetical protein [Providencia sp.]UNJ80098.1 hypothetical protein [Providencia sp.]